MERINQYREIIEKTLATLAAVPHRYGQIEDRVVSDRQTDNYLWLSEGWNKARRIHHCIAHLEIISGKIWIQKDQTEEGIATYLEEAGVPKDAIVLGFHPLDVRQHTEYAAA